MCHVEITSLIVPGQNDNVKDIEALSKWLAEISPDTPLHVTRFFPRYKMLNKAATPVETIETLTKATQKILKYVYSGNI